jgi:hypothetical protein
MADPKNPNPSRTQIYLAWAGMAAVLILLLWLL